MFCIMPPNAGLLSEFHTSIRPNPSQKTSKFHEMLKNWLSIASLNRISFMELCTTPPNFRPISEMLNTLRQNCHHFADDIFKCISFQVHFLEWKLLNFKGNFTEIFSLGFNWQYGSIGSNNALAPNRRQVIIWTNDDLGYWRAYMRNLASMSLRVRPKTWLSWNISKFQETSKNLNSDLLHGKMQHITKFQADIRNPKL